MTFNKKSGFLFKHPTNLVWKVDGHMRLLSKATRKMTRVDDFKCIFLLNFPKMILQVSIEEAEIDSNLTFNIK